MDIQMNIREGHDDEYPHRLSDLGHLIVTNFIITHELLTISFSQLPEGCPRYLNRLSEICRHFRLEYHLV